MVDDLVLGQRLGGSRAAVHRATDARTGATVVAKRAGWEHPSVTAALAREAAILERVGHRSLVRLIDVRDDVEGRCLVLAHAAGGDLEARLRMSGAMDARAAADLGARLAGALAALHAAGVVHRDVRPCNVVVDTELVPVLCDLDHALDGGAPPLATDEMVVGDPAHLDRRLLDGVPADARADLFGLGSTVWAAATGGAERPADARGAAARVSTPLAAAIVACLTGQLASALDAAHLFDRTASLVRDWPPGSAPPDRPARGSVAPRPAPTRRWSPPTRTRA